ncbi:hypothetical protein [Microbacterium sp. SLBN-111]|uniref:hypothetical protein n=1 Tax=Microbacterium sp. SLBN-111 TaxID=3377733 RepID=UPI003C76AA1D
MPSARPDDAGAAWVGAACVGAVADEDAEGEGEGEVDGVSRCADAGAGVVAGRAAALSVPPPSEVR